jgi:putative transposase
MVHPLIFVVSLGARAIRALFISRSELLLENLALRQQVLALKRAHPRPLLDDVDRAFGVALRGCWRGRVSRLIMVDPDTVTRWNRGRFRRHWAHLSRRRRPGRPRIDREIRELIRCMAHDGWGEPRIHGELLKLGFEASESTVSRYMPRRPVEPDKVKRWIAFLRNHKDGIAAMDFFTVPTASLRVAYVLFIIQHDRREIVHFNVTFNPTSAWVIQQLRESFAFDSAPKYLIFDRDCIFNAGVFRFVKALGTEPVRTAYRSPWQNAIAERWIGSCRRELLDYVVVLGEQHLRRLIRSYVAYYREDRCHLGLQKDVPRARDAANRPSSTAKVVALPRVGGLHHRYEWREAA